MATAPRGSRDVGARAAPGRARILDGARALLLTGGPRALTVSAIAAAAGVSPPALYKHFRDREEVIRALHAEAWQLFRKELERARRARGPMQRIQRCGELHVRFGLRDPQRYRLLFMREDDTFEPGTREPDRDRDAGAGLELLMELIRDAARAGLLPEDIEDFGAGKRPSDTNVFELAVAYWATCHGLVSLHLAGGGAARFERGAYEKLARRALARLLQARPDLTRSGADAEAPPRSRPRRRDP